MANAATLDFDFTITGMSGGHPTGDTVTGEIDGLSDNSTGTASAVILESFPASLGPVCSTPCDTTKNPPWSFALNANPPPPILDVFTVSGGQVTSANFVSVNLNLSELEFLPQSGVTGVLFGPGGDMLGGPVTFSPVTSATPLSAALPLFATGLGALGLLGWRRKRKSRASLLGAA